MLSQWSDFDLYWEECAEGESIYQEVHVDGTASFYRLCDNTTAGNGLALDALYNGANKVSISDDSFDCWAVDASTGKLSKWRLPAEQIQAVDQSGRQLATHNGKWVFYINAPVSEDGLQRANWFEEEADYYERQYTGILEILEKDKSDSYSRSVIEDWFSSSEKENDSIKTLIVHKAKGKMREWLAKEFGEKELEKWSEREVLSLAEGFKDHCEKFFEESSSGEVVDFSKVDEKAERIAEERGWK